VTCSRDARADAANRRLDSFIDRYIAHAGLAIGLALTPFVLRDAAPAEWMLIGALVAVTAGWCLHFVTLPPVRAARSPATGLVYMCGFWVLMVALVALSPLFAFMAFAGYGHAFAFLRGRWRWTMTGLIAIPVAYSQIGGRFAQITPGTLAALGVLVVANALVAGAFTYWGTLTAERSVRRGETIVELEETNRRLSVALAQNAALHERLLAQARESGVTEERQRMAREIHDTIAQGLAGIVAQLEAADAADDRPAERRRHIDTARALARESLTEARRSVHALAPAPLEHAHLPDAVTDLVKRWAETSGVAPVVTTTGEPRPLLADLEVTLFRVVQEALANVGKHARASAVAVTLSYTDTVVVVDVCDDGAGFVPGPTGGSACGRCASGWSGPGAS
jgi:signal transduction histidine kinase